MSDSNSQTALSSRGTKRKHETITLSWHSSEEAFVQASETEIEDLFDSTPSSSLHDGNARRVADTIVVKRIAFNGAREYFNQYVIWLLLNGKRLRVPKPIRFCEVSDEYHCSTGYFVMERLKGPTLEEAGSEENIQAACKAVRFLHERTRQPISTKALPGTLPRGSTDAFPWGLSRVKTPFSSIEALEECVNRRLDMANWKAKKRREVEGWQLNLLDQPELVFCHMDLAPRNIIVLEDGIGIGIVDWATAQLLPPIFESASLLWCEHMASLQEKPIVKGLRDGILPLTPRVESDMKKLVTTNSMGIKYGC